MSVRTQKGFLKFEHETASARLTLWDDRTASVSGVHSRVRGQGHAKEVLRELCEFADDQELDLDLHVSAYGLDGGLTNAQLIEFYKKFHFEVIPDGGFPVLMARHHR